MDWWLLLSCVCLGFFWAGCPCCSSGPCQFASDTFNRADNTDINTGSTVGWTETSGSWSIASNKLSTSSANAKATASTAHPDGTPYMKVVTIVQGDTSGDTIRIDVGDIYAEAKLGAGTGYLKIYDSGGNVVSEDDTLTLHTGSAYTFTVCVNSSGVQASLFLGFTVTNITWLGTVTGSTFALGTGGTVTGTVTFDSVTADRVEAACSTCGVFCNAACNDNTSPAYYQVVISGMANGSCGSCASYDGTYILHQTSSDCAWRYNLGSAFCSVFDKVFLLHTAGTPPVPPGSDMNSVVFIANTVLATDPQTVGSWNDVVAGGVVKRDCNFGATVFGLRFENVCDLTPSTCTVTAL
jgi:hypothetical protein